MIAKHGLSRFFCVKQHLNLAFWAWRQYVSVMIMKLVEKQIYKECIIVLICFLIFGNLAHGVVLCFGVDGHIKIKSTLHERCDDPVHSQPTDPKQLSYQINHIEDRHCEPCEDIPISISLAKICRMPKQLNSTFPASASNVIVPANKFDLSAYDLDSNTFDTTSYFTPLRTVILLIWFVRRHFFFCHFYKIFTVNGQIVAIFFWYSVDKSVS